MQKGDANLTANVAYYIPISSHSYVSRSDFSPLKWYTANTVTNASCDVNSWLLFQFQIDWSLSSPSNIVGPRCRAAN